MMQDMVFSRSDRIASPGGQSAQGQAAAGAPTAAPPPGVFDWAKALEAGAEVRLAGSFLSWLEQFLRPQMYYDMVACGDVVRLGRQLRVNRMLCRALPQCILDDLRDDRGVVTLPLPGWGTASLAVGNTSVGPHRETQALRRADEPERLTVHTQPDSTGRSGTFFLFGKLREPPSAEHDRQPAILDLLGPTMHALLVRSLEADQRTRIAVEPAVVLSPREMHVLYWIIAGRTSPEIALQTSRSVHTITNQVRAIMRKFGANNRTEVAFLAVSLGVVPARGSSSSTRVHTAQRRARYRSRSGLPAAKSG